MANPATATAVGPMTIVAVEQYVDDRRRLVRDDLAAQFLPASTRLFVRLARWRPLQNLLIRVTEQNGRGLWAGFLCRKRYIDDKIREAAADMEAMVNLGAGLDTRAYRMPELARIPVFEVDLPENVSRKQAILERLFGKAPEHVHLVPVDFESQSLEAVLAGKGYRADQRTFFVWEGVTQYLTEDGARKTFAFLAQAAVGSRLVFTYVRKDFIEGTNLYDAAPIYERFRARQQLWQFGMAPDEVATFLNEYGWRVLEHVGSQELSARYVQPSGREMPVSEVERMVYAVKQA